MKRLKKILALALAMAMVLGMTSMAAFAADNGTITVTNATIGKEYAAYKVFDATYQGDAVSYTVKAGDLKSAAESSTSPFNVATVADADGNYAVTLKDGKSATDVVTWMKANVDKFAKQGDTVTAASSTVTFNGLPYGYYYVTSSLGAAVTIDTVAPNASVIDKNQEPSWDNGENQPGKVIIDDGNTKVSSNEAKLGEDITFDIGVTATNYNADKQILEYFIHDQMDDGMTYKAGEGTFKVQVVNGATTTDIQPYNAETNKTGYTVTYYKKDGTVTTTLSEAQKFTVKVPWVDTTVTGEEPDQVTTYTSKYASPVELHVQYIGFLDPAKKDDVKIGLTNSNNNKAIFDWVDTEDKKNEKDNPTPDTPNHTEPEKNTKTYTTQVTIHKTDENGDALSGAEFQLVGQSTNVVIVTKDTFTEDAEHGTFWKLKNGKYTTDDPTIMMAEVDDPETPDVDESTTPKYDNSLYDSISKKYSKTVVAVVQGNQTNPVDIKAEVTADGTVTFAGLADGNYTIKETKVPAGYNKAADIEFTISHTTTGTIGNQTVAFKSSNDKVVLDGTTGLFDVTIVNEKGQQLPSTGGIGTTIFYVVGTILVIGAGVVLITKRRMDA